MLWLVAAPLPASAATLNPILFQPAVFSGDLLTLSTARTGGGLGFTVALGAHYTQSPLSFSGTDAWGRTYTEQTIRNRVMGELLLGFTPFELLEIGVAMPLVLSGDGSAYLLSESQQPGSPNRDTSGFHVGELRASLKLRIVSTESFGLAVLGEATLPTAAEEPVVGNGLGGGGRLAMDLYLGPMTMTLNAGVYIRADEGELYDGLTVGHEMVMGLGGELDLFAGLALVGESYVRTPLTSPFGDEGGTAMESIGALRWSHPVGLAITAGGGGGAPFLAGYGASKYRFFGDVRYSMTPSQDSDEDGVPDDDDLCASLPEDLDGFEDSDGCPDPDNDHDGFLDGLDGCPDEAEDFDEFEDQDGCRDSDNDGDYVLDDVDRCVGLAEDHDGFEDEDGCPEGDNDGDGVDDMNDRCPNSMESLNGFEDDDGCPDYKGVTQDADRIALSAPVRFHESSDAILPRSFDILRAAARFINDNPSFKVIRIDVHTSMTGKREKVALEPLLVESASARVQHLLQFLVTEGVAPRRLRLRAVGGSEPIADPRDPAEFERNERVDFVITQFE